MAPDASMRFLASGVQADVYLIDYPGPEQRAVLKLVDAPENGDVPTLRPHNVAREARLLSRQSHPNIVRLLSSSFNPPLEYRLVLEYLTHPLPSALLHARSQGPEELNSLFIRVATGLFSALEHLHAHNVAHRDIKPDNVLLTADMMPKLIDLATAYDPDDDLGDDGKGGMVCQVGTGAYRAPELLFSPTSYDARAIDLWAAGATLSEFYRPSRAEVRARSRSGSSGSGSLESSPPLSTSTHRDPPLDDYDPLEHDARQDDGPAPLFDATFGEVGLAASIFRLLGTPTPTSWPSFTSLPDASNMLAMFEPREPRPLASELVDPPDAVVQVVSSVLVLEPGARATAADIVCMLDKMRTEGDSAEVGES